MPDYSMTELIDRAYAILKENGLVVEREALNLSGERECCGTTKKPDGTDGRYRIHLDFPPTLWLCNYHEGGEGRTFRLYGEDELKRLTAKELKELKERIQQHKEAERVKLQRKREEAARRAETLFRGYSPAGEENPYLKRKQCLPLGNLRECQAEASPYAKALSGACLVVPMLNAEGKIRSLQFVDGEGNKRFLHDGQKQGCYFPIPVPAKDGSREGPLLVGEGVATVLSCCQTTGYSGLVAFDCNNLEAVGKVAREKYPARELIFLGDNDCSDKEGNPVPDERNAGLQASTKAARAVGGKMALCPSLHGLKVDFNDLAGATEDGLLRVRQVIEEARKGKAQTLPEKKKSYRCLNVAELIAKDYPPREMILTPILPVQSLSMVYAMRGVGKTYFALSVAYAVASGGTVFGRWFAKAPQKVLYIDGEMPAVTLQERLKSIALSSDSDIRDPNNLSVFTPDEQESSMPNLATREGQEALEPFLEGVSLVVVDNIATLARTGKANDEDAWLPVQEWLLTLRRRGISVLLVHHAGKNGSQRGTGAKEDILDTVIELKRPSDYRTEEGARFEVHFTKARGLYGSDVEPFEAMWRTDEKGQYGWVTKKVDDLIEMRVLELLEAGCSEREIVEELKEDHVGRNRVRQIRQKFEAEGKSFSKSKGGYYTHKKQADSLEKSTGSEVGTGSGVVNKYSDRQEEELLTDEHGKVVRANQAKIETPSLPEKNLRRGSLWGNARKKTLVRIRWTIRQRPGG